MALRPVFAFTDRAREIRRLAEDLMGLHGLADWSFAFNRHRRSLGLCRYETRTIELSIYLVEGNPPEEVRDTLLHEIAHALVGPGHGHDAVWRRQCVAIGARPLRCGRADMPAGRWKADCPACGKKFHLYRRPKRLHGWFCLACGEDRGRLVWKLR